MSFLVLFFAQNRSLNLIGAGLLGFVLCPILKVSYESAAALTRSSRVGEAFSSNLVNTAACAISAIQHLLILCFVSDHLIAFKFGLGLIGLNLGTALGALHVIHKDKSS